MEAHSILILSLYITKTVYDEYLQIRQVIEEEARPYLLKNSQLNDG